MKKHLVLIAVLILACALFAPGVARLDGAASSERAIKSQLRDLQRAMRSREPVTAVVELSSESVVEHVMKTPQAAQAGSRAELHSFEAQSYESELTVEQQRFEAEAALAAPDMRVVSRLRKLANAISIEVPGEQLAQIAALPGVSHIELTQEYEATLAASLPLINAPSAWQSVGGAETAGQGIKVAILDSGIDITNPLFDGSGYAAPAGFPRGVAGFTNGKVIVGKVFLADVNATPADEHGHGTHVAGIAAGNRNTPAPLAPISGVAPRAYLGNYRVLDKNGSGRNDLIARGLEEALADGFDIANMSLGGDAASEFNVLDRAVERAVAAGLVVVVSAGNSGAKGEMSITSPATVPAAISVTATTNSHVVLQLLGVADDASAPPSLKTIKLSKGVGSANSIDNLQWPMPYTDLSALDPQGRGCGPLAATTIAGKAALVERGICAFPAKVNNVATSGAGAVIIYNKDISEGADGGDALLNMDVTGTTVPSMFIGHGDGIALGNWLKEHPQARLNYGIGELPFSADVSVPTDSTGPTPAGDLKPDLAAPGVFVYSGAIKEPNPKGVSDPSGFVAVSGTSQAAPHIAGSAALLKQLHPSWTPQQIKSALVNSSIDSVLSSTKNARAGVLTAGAGRVDLMRAFSIGATLKPSSISYGIHKVKKKGAAFTGDLQLTSLLDGRRAFRVSIDQIDGGNGVVMSLSQTQLVLDQGESANVTVTISLLKSAERRDYSGFVVFEDFRGQVLRAPFWGRFKKK